MDNNNDKSSNTPACAACRHQRRKCKVGDCVLWPYFSSDRMEDFQSVQRVFGICNVTKMIRELEKHDRAEAAKSFFWEAKCWSEDPVCGPLGRFNQLKQELSDLKAMYQHVTNVVGTNVTSTLQVPGDNFLPRSSVQHSYPSPNLVQGQVKERLVISDGGFSNPYPSNFGQGIGPVWSGPVISRPYDQTQNIRTNLLTPQQVRAQPQMYNFNQNSPVPGLIRGDEYVRTMYSCDPNFPVRGVYNVGTFFSSPSSFPITGEDRNNFRTFFSGTPGLSIRGYRENVNVGTIFPSHDIRGDEDNVTNPPVKRDGDDLAAFCQQQLNTSNHDNVEDQDAKQNRSRKIPFNG